MKLPKKLQEKRDKHYPVIQEHKHQTYNQELRKAAWTSESKRLAYNQAIKDFMELEELREIIISFESLYDTALLNMTINSKLQNEARKALENWQKMMEWE